MSETLRAERAEAALQQLREGLAQIIIHWRDLAARHPMGEPHNICADRLAALLASRPTQEPKP